MNLKAILVGASAAALVLMAGVGSASAVTISNTANGNSIQPFGSPDTQTYGEVVTAPVSGTLTAFTLSLDGGVGELEGGVGTWNGSASFGLGFGSPATLFTSSAVASTGAQSFTFNPNVSVSAGSQYVVFLTVFGLSGANATTDMPLGNDTAGLDYFVWNNSNSPFGNTGWNYSFDSDKSIGGTGLTSVTYSVSATPLPSTWTMLIAGFAGLGFFAYRGSKKSAAAIAA